MTTLIIVNPASGHGTGKMAIPVIQDILQKAQYPFELVETQRPWHAAELARQAALDGVQNVVAVGGDGTANEVLNGLLMAAGERPQGAVKTVMGIISVGRGNDFAFGMGIPKGIEAGCQVLLQGHRQLVDAGRVTGGDYPQGRYFGNGVGIGFDAVVGFQAARMKYLQGFANYIVAALQTIFLYYHAPLVRVECDEQVFVLPALMVSIMNGRRMGGGFMMAPDSQPGDGWLDLCIAAQVNRARIFGLIPHFMKGTQATQKSIQTCRARRVVTTALQGSLPAHADGETICYRGEKLSIELFPQCIEIFSTPKE